MSQNKNRKFEKKEVKDITELNESRRIGRWFQPYNSGTEQLNRRSAFLKVSTRR